MTKKADSQSDNSGGQFTPGGPGSGEDEGSTEHNGNDEHLKDEQKSPKYNELE